MDFEDVNGFLKLLKEVEVPSMKNNLSYNFFSNNLEIEEIMLTNYMLIKKIWRVNNIIKHSGVYINSDVYLKYEPS